MCSTTATSPAASWLAPARRRGRSWTSPPTPSWSSTPGVSTNGRAWTWSSRWQSGPDGVGCASCWWARRGRGPVERRAESLPNVIVRPWQPFDSVLRYLDAADVLLVPPSAAPLRGGGTVLPLKLFSYLAAGRPPLRAADRGHRGLPRARPGRLLDPAGHGPAKRQSARRPRAAPRRRCPSPAAGRRREGQGPRSDLGRASRAPGPGARPRPGLPRRPGPIGRSPECSVVDRALARAERPLAGARAAAGALGRSGGPGTPGGARRPAGGVSGSRGSGSVGRPLERARGARR